MAAQTLLFHYCPKLIVFSEDKKSVLLARRFGEADYNGAYTFIGGKSETTDGGLLVGLQREKNEEIGPDAKLKVCYMMSCYQVWYTKKDGNSMVLPHHIAIYQGGEIKLNPNEYDDYKWVPLAEIDRYNDIKTTAPAVRAGLRYLPLLGDDDFVEI
jgi:8-oxo-dGTP pyrophosphatase MutT (NUDIX family)